jgi:hypothetical protein
MENMSVLTNSTVKVYARVVDEFDVLTDPQGIRFIYVMPDDTEYTYIYGDGETPTVQKKETGIYYMQLDLTMTGKHRYTWESYGLIQGAYKGFIQVENDRWQ